VASMDTRESHNRSLPSSGSQPLSRVRSVCNFDDLFG
jgi:hypothetical protein